MTGDNFYWTYPNWTYPNWTYPNNYYFVPTEVSIDKTEKAIQIVDTLIKEKLIKEMKFNEFVELVKKIKGLI